MFTVDFDRASVKISDKIWNLTLGLVKQVLETAGVDEGGWYLKAPHRVRKKGHERFRALRLDDRVGTKGIRIRCKPQGNETSFEYTLVPPEGTNLNDLFILLQRVNPKTLEIYDTLALKSAIENPGTRGIEFPVTKAIVDNIYKKIKSEPERPTTLPERKFCTPPKPKFTPPTPKPLAWLRDKQAEAEADKSNIIEQEKLDVKAEEGTSFKEIATTVSSPEPPTNQQQIVREICEKYSDPMDRIRAWKELHEEPKRSPIEDKIEKITSLALTEPTLLGDQEVLDRALVAMAFVATDGYCARVDASNSIIKNLEILNFIENVSEGAYNAVESAMRSLTMALRKNNYIERVYYGKSEAVRGYKFTPKAEKRILALQKFLGENIINQINPSWGKFVKQEEFVEEVHEIPETSAQDDISGQNVVEAQNSETPKNISARTSAEEVEAEGEHYSRLESLISALRDVNDQIVEAEGFINNLNSEKTDLDAELYGIEKAIEEQIRCKEEIERRISKFQEKQKEIKSQIETKEREIVDWQEFQVPCFVEKNKLKKQMEDLAGAVGIGLRAPV